MYLVTCISLFLSFSVTISGACPGDYPDEVCRYNTSLKMHNPPILYNLHTDPGELYELDPYQYADVLEQINQVRQIYPTVCMGVWVFFYIALLNN